jgi:hypothetical protein
MSGIYGDAWYPCRSTFWGVRTGTHMGLSPRQSRAVRLINGSKLEQFGDDRTCAAPTCGAKLSKYNPSPRCATHAGWADPAAAPRTRRRNDV